MGIIKKVAQDFIDAVLMQLEALDTAKRNEKIVIGIDSSWIPREQRLSVINGLLDSLEKISRKFNSRIVIKTGFVPSVLAKELWDHVGEEEGDAPLSNVIILGDKNVLDKAEFSRFKNFQEENHYRFSRRVS